MNAIDYAALLKPEALIFPEAVKDKTSLVEEFRDGIIRYRRIFDQNGYRRFPQGTLESVHYAEDGTVESLIRTRGKKGTDPASLHTYHLIKDGKGSTKTGRFLFTIGSEHFTMEDTVALDTNRLLQRRYLSCETLCSYKGLPATSSYDKKTGELIEEVWAIQKKARNRWYGTSTTHRPVAEGPAVIQYKDGKIIKQIFMENGKVRKDPAEVKTTTRKKRAITAGQVAEWISSQPENISKLNEVLDVALQVSVGEKR